MKIERINSLVVAILILFYIGVIMTLLISNNSFNSNILKDIFLTTTSFITLIIAILIYDRFGYRKIIFEKKLDIVLKLLEKIKSTQIIVSYENREERKMSICSVMINQEEVNRLNETLNPKAYVVFSIEELNTYFKEMNLMCSNIYMPKEISKRLEFISITYLEGVTGNKTYENENIKLSINKNVGNISSLDGWYKTHEDLSFETFTNNYFTCVNTIENWINKYSSIRADLNI